MEGPDVTIKAEPPIAICGNTTDGIDRQLGVTPSHAAPDAVAVRDATEQTDGELHSRDIQSGAHQIEPINTGDSDASVPMLCPNIDPSAQLPPDGRDERGRFTPGNVAALKHGARRSLDAPDIAEAVEDERRAFVAHVGGPDALSPTLDRYLRSTARVAVLEDGAFNKLVEQGGPVTGKNRRRALFDVWSQLDDKLTRRLERLGFERAQKRVVKVADIIREYAGKDGAA
jgi:hypothetical protein